MGKKIATITDGEKKSEEEVVRFRATVFCKTNPGTGDIVIILQPDKEEKDE